MEIDLKPAQEAEDAPSSYEEESSEEVSEEELKDEVDIGISSARLDGDDT